jgi:hypothetical protein
MSLSTTMVSDCFVDKNAASAQGSLNQLVVGSIPYKAHTLKKPRSYVLLQPFPRQTLALAIAVIDHNSEFA